MSYKLVKEDDKAYTIRHPQGHDFQVVKKGLSKDTHAKIKAMPLCNGGVVKMADGGVVPADDGGPLLPPAPQGPGPAFTQIFQPDFTPGSMDRVQMGNAQTQLDNITKNNAAAYAGLSPGEMATKNAADMQEQSPLMTQPSVANDALANQAAAAQELLTQGGNLPGPSVPQMPGLSMGPQNPMGQLAAGYNAMAKAQGDLGNNLAQNYQQTQDAMAKEQAETKAHLDQLEQQRQEFAKAYEDSKIDPNRYLASKSTGSKILAALSIAFGGAVSASTGGRNAALDIMNDSINKDIEAQKADVNKKQNLLSENLRMTNDIRQAEAQTRLQMLTMAEVRAKQLSAQAQGPIAKAQAQMVMGQLQAQMAPLQMQIAQAQRQAYVGNNGIDRNQAEAYAATLPPKEAEAFQQNSVPVGNKIYVHRGKPEDAQEARVVESKVGSVMDQVDQLSKLGRSALIPGTQEHAKAEAIRASLATSIPSLKSAFIGAKRINGEEVEAGEKAINNPATWAQMLTNGVKNTQFLKDTRKELNDYRTENYRGYRAPSDYGFTPRR